MVFFRQLFTEVFNNSDFKSIDEISNFDTLIK